MARSDGDIRFEKLLRSIGYAVLAVQGAADRVGEEECQLVDIRFKLGADNGTSVLVICKGVLGGEKRVAFVGAPSFETAVLAVGKALQAKVLRWREDRPYQE